MQLPAVQEQWKLTKISLVKALWTTQVQVQSQNTSLLPLWITDHCRKLLIICTAQLGLCHPLGMHCMCLAWQIRNFFLWQETIYTARCDGAGWFGFTKTTSLERKQHHYLLGISRADRGRIQTIQDEGTQSSKSSWKTCKESPCFQVAETDCWQ